MQGNLCDSAGLKTGFLPRDVAVGWKLGAR
jgi:hypothetical protein